MSYLSGLVGVGAGRRPLMNREGRGPGGPKQERPSGGTVLQFPLKPGVPFPQNEIPKPEGGENGHHGGSLPLNLGATRDPETGHVTIRRQGRRRPPQALRNLAGPTLDEFFKMLDDPKDPASSEVGAGIPRIHPELGGVAPINGGDVFRFSPEDRSMVDLDASLPERLRPNLMAVLPLRDKTVSDGGYPEDSLLDVFAKTLIGLMTRSTSDCSMSVLSDLARGGIGEINVEMVIKVIDSARTVIDSLEEKTPKTVFRQIGTVLTTLMNNLLTALSRENTPKAEEMFREIYSLFLELRGPLLDRIALAPE